MQDYLKEKKKIGELKLRQRHTKKKGGGNIIYLGVHLKTTIGENNRPTAPQKNVSLHE